MKDPPLVRCRVVLVRTQFAGNIGATARVMVNMGARDLVLVAPQADIAEAEARRLATHGVGVLDSARIVGTLDEALSDCVLVVGTSARSGGLVRRQSVVLPETAAERLLEAMSSGPVALVFGPESSGLLDVEVTRCHWLINIPTDETHPALNLAQSACICLYELRRAWLRRESVAATEPIAPFQLQERAFEDLRVAFEEIGYLRGEKGDALMHGMRHLLGRAGPTEMETKLLLGLARQIRWFVRGRGEGPCSSDD